MTTDLQSQYETAVLKVRERKTVSTAFLHNTLNLPYGQAAELIDWMEFTGIITAPLANGTRKVCNPIKKPKPVYTPEQLLGSG